MNNHKVKRNIQPCLFGQEITQLSSEVSLRVQTEIFPTFIFPEASTVISGIGVYYPDGTETQRMGRIPDIVVQPTIEGIKERKDEISEKLWKL